MTNSLFIHPEGPRLVKPIDRRRLLLAGTAAGAGLVMPRISWAASDGCNTLNNLLTRARKQAKDPRPWTRKNGALAATRIQQQISEARKKLDEALKRDGKLDQALFVDVLSLVGGAAFFAAGIYVLTAAGIAAAATTVTVGAFTATAGTILLVSGLLFNGTMFFAQLATNSTPPDTLGIVTTGGILETTLGEMDDGFVAISKNIGKYMGLAGRLLGAVSLAAAAKEAWDTYFAGAEVDEALQELRDELADLEPELAELRATETMNELRQASARSLVDDLEANRSSDCPPPKPKKRPRLIKN